MKQGLQEINELDGVWGSLICNNQGDLIASVPPPGFESSQLENISRHCVQMLSESSVSVQGLEEMVFYFKQKRLLVLDLQQAVMIVFCTPSIDISLLRMTINVVTSRWDGDKKIQKQFRDRFVERQ